MKIKVTFILVLITKIVFGQMSGNIGIGYNQFTNTLNNYKRSNGATLHLELEKAHSALFSFSYGMNISLAHETYNIKDFNSDLFTKYNKTSISVQYPILLVTQLKEDVLYLNTGISINIDNFILLGDYIYTYDYEIYGEDRPILPKRGYGVGVQLGIVYYPINRIGLFAECKTTNNKWFGFIYGEVGIKIGITKRKKFNPSS